MAQSGQPPLVGIKVLDLSRIIAGPLCCQQMADMGADLILVDPPRGDPSRDYPPFLANKPGANRSLYWWHYHTSKRAMVLDLEDPDGAKTFRKLIATTDVLIEAEPRDRLANLQLDYANLSEINPDLIHIAVTTHARNGPHYHGLIRTSLELRLRRPLTPAYSRSVTGLSDSVSLRLHVGTDRPTPSRRIGGRAVH